VTAPIAQVFVNGDPVEVSAGATVAAAIGAAGVRVLRLSPTGAPRGPLCGMGVCFECRVIVDGRAHVRSCMEPCVDGMEIRTLGD
jgi:sarcosine oxidase subunit alpha